MGQLQKPDWFDIEEPKPAQETKKQERLYWTLRGELHEGKAMAQRERFQKEGHHVYIDAFRTKEEAEAYAVYNRDSHKTFGWVWDKKPATRVKLKTLMRSAREYGCDGVGILAYENGDWVAVEEYPANVPLLD